MIKEMWTICNDSDVQLVPTAPRDREILPKTVNSTNHNERSETSKDPGWSMQRSRKNINHEECEDPRNSEIQKRRPSPLASVHASEKSDFHTTEPSSHRDPYLRTGSYNVYVDAKTIYSTTKPWIDNTSISKLENLTFYRNPERPRHFQVMKCCHDRKYRIPPDKIRMTTNNFRKLAIKRVCFSYSSFGKTLKTAQSETLTSDRIIAPVGSKYLPVLTSEKTCIQIP